MVLHVRLCKHPEQSKYSFNFLTKQEASSDPGSIEKWCPDPWPVQYCLSQCSKHKIPPSLPVGPKGFLFYFFVCFWLPFILSLWEAQMCVTMHLSENNFVELFYLAYLFVCLFSLCGPQELESGPQTWQFLPRARDLSITPVPWAFSLAVKGSHWPNP